VIRRCEKIPHEFYDLKKSALEGLDTGSMSATEIISMCCKALHVDENRYLDRYDFSLSDVILSIKLAMLLKLSDGDFSQDTKITIKNTLIEFLELSSVLKQADIDLIFSHAIGTDEQQKQLLSLNFEDIQVLFVDFFHTINDNKINNFLLDCLSIVIGAEGEMGDNEFFLFGLLVGLLKSEENRK